MMGRPQLTFDRLLQRIDEIETARDRAARTKLVQRLWEQIAEVGTPLILDDRHAAFVYRGPGQRVRVLGDMTNWSGEVALQQVAETDLFMKVESLPPEARIEYLLAVDDRTGPDPHCPHRVLNGLGAHSELAMPAYVHHPAFDDSIRQGALGGYDRVVRCEVSSAALGMDKEIHVYRPPGYEQMSDLPAVYIHDGRDYIEYAHTPVVLDHLISRGRVAPLVAVFISPPNRHQPTAPNRTTEYGLNPDYARFMAEELVPWIDQRFGTLARPAARMTAGDSYAGLVSAYIPLVYPHVFGIGYSQSGYLSCQGDALIARYRQAERLPIRLYVDIGHYERSVGQGWLPDTEIDFLAANRRFREALQEAKYDFVYREYPEGHTWGNWRKHLADALEHFFPAAAD